MVNSTATPSANTAPAPSLIITGLLTELHYADRIIKVMDDALSIKQKAHAQNKLKAAGVTGDDVARRDERAAAIAAATKAVKDGLAIFALGKSVRPHLPKVKAFAFDIGDQGGHIEVLLGALLEKLDDLLRPGGEREVVAIHCFATCALRNAVLMREAADNIASLVAEVAA